MSRRILDAEHVRYAVEEIQRMGGEAVLSLTAKCHVKCLIKFKNKQKPIFISGTPDKNFPIKNILRLDIKRAFAELSQ